MTTTAVLPSEKSRLHREIDAVIHPDMVQRRRGIAERWIASVALQTKADGVGVKNIEAMARNLANHFRDESFVVASCDFIVQDQPFFPWTAGFYSKLTEWERQTAAFAGWNIEVPHLGFEPSLRAIIARWQHNRVAMDDPASRIPERMELERGLPGRLHAIANDIRHLGSGSPAALNAVLDLPGLDVRTLLTGRMTSFSVEIRQGGPVEEGPLELSHQRRIAAEEVED